MTTVPAGNVTIIACALLAHKCLKDLLRKIGQVTNTCKSNEKMYDFSPFGALQLALLRWNCEYL